MKIFVRSLYTDKNKQQIKVSTLYIKIVTNKDEERLDKINIHNINEFEDFFKSDLIFEYQNSKYSLRQLVNINGILVFKEDFKMTEQTSSYIKVTKMVKNCLLENVQVEITDGIDALKRLRRTIKTEEQFRRMKWTKSNELHGMLNLVYMSSDLKVEDEIYQNLTKQIHSIVMISYYDED